MKLFCLILTGLCAALAGPVLAHDVGLSSATVQLRTNRLEALLTFVSAMPAPPREVEADAKLVKQGDALFHSEKTACGSCHTEGGTDSRNHDLGSKAKADRKAAFNTPSLSYLSGRGPFFHDGRFDNLRDLLVQSDGMMGHTKGLDEKELGALEAYLNSL